MEKIKVLINEQELDKRITEIAKDIQKEYQNKEITLICILKGSIFFTVDLARKIKGDVKLEFIRVSSYEGNSTESSGEIKIKLDLNNSIAGKNIIVIEDIIDTGRTLAYLINYLKKQNPQSIKLCTLLDKKERRVCEVKVDYTGFEIPDKFVVGYGLDVDEKYRHIPYIGYIEN